MKRIIACFVTCATVCSFVSCNQTPKDTLEYTTKKSTESISASESVTVKPIDPPEITGDVAAELEDGLTVWESFDPDKHAVKLIFVGNKQYYFPDLNPEYVVNVKYDLFQNGGGFFQALMKPMETPITVYLPVADYLNGKSFVVRWDSVNDKLQVTHHDTAYQPSIDVFSYYSDEPIRVKDEFLHFALTEHFGGKYSERDLLQIGQITYNCNSLNISTFQRTANFIALETTRDELRYVYYYTKLTDSGEKPGETVILHPDPFTACAADEQPVEIPDAALADIERYFHGLHRINLYHAPNFKDPEADRALIRKYEAFKQRALKKYLATDIPMIGD